MTTKTFKIAALMLSLLALGTTGCIDMVRDSVAQGLADAANNTVDTAFGFLTIPVDSTMQAIRDFLNNGL